MVSNETDNNPKSEEYELTLDYTKELLIPAMFPSDEDGNPKDYTVSFNYATNRIILKRV